MANKLKNRLHNITDKIKSSIVYKSFRLFFSRPQNILFFILIDLVFITLLVILNGLMGLLLNTLKSSPIILTLTITAINVIAVIIFYSIAKKKVLDVLFSYKDNKTISWSELKAFIVMNFIIYFIFFIIIFIVAGLVYFTIKEDYFKNIISVLLIIISIIAYAFINIAHIKYTKNKSFGFVLKSSWDSIGKFESYKPIVSSIIIFLSYLLFISAISVLVTYIAFRMTQNTSILEIYTMIVTIIGIIILYISHLFNRIYYLNLIKE